jgi:subtilisin family serine protease
MGAVLRFGLGLAALGLLAHATTDQRQGAIPPAEAWIATEGPGARYTTDAAWPDRFEPDLARGVDAATSDALYVISLEFDSAASRQQLRVPGVTVLTSIDRFADVFVRAMPDGEIDRTALDGIFQAPGLRWLDPITPVRVPPPAVPGRGERTRALPEPIVQGGVAGLTGKGVIVAVIDTGIDFRNPDFITIDGSGQPVSRLLYLWDTYDDSFDRGRGGSKAPYVYPSGR